LAPFQGAIIKQILDTYPNLQEVVWLQEEPKNMGGWSFMVRHLRDLLADSHPVRYIGRPERSSPAEGSLVQHNHEQGQIVAAAFEGGVARESRAGANGAKAKVAKSDRVGADPVSARRKQPAAASSAE
ncbi:MAG: hypothetical protein ACR2GS_01295, partial [Thermomicrobiales bacterium]